MMSVERSVTQTCVPEGRYKLSVNAPTNAEGTPEVQYYFGHYYEGQGGEILTTDTSYESPTFGLDACVSFVELQTLFHQSIDIFFNILILLSHLFQPTPIQSTIKYFCTDADADPADSVICEVGDVYDKSSFTQDVVIRNIVNREECWLAQCIGNNTYVEYH